ncbi:hypothetical protein, partial [uncultured Catenibacterium sp.]|uniref:hypothetical protein n=1 Tax=uncultured Catenibacterium sp. TaxID=286142 RepID=UPI0025F1EFA9
MGYRKRAVTLKVVVNTICYEMTIVKRKYHISLGISLIFVLFCFFKIKDIGQETSIQIYRRLAT